jgi:hydrogenase maturation protease
LGIGNPGRRDDGLGPAFVERIEALRLPGVDCKANYQLNLEDAQACSVHDVVVFADAAETLDGPFALTPLEPSPRFTMSTHSLPPEGVLAVCEAVYGIRPRACLLAIQGHRWEIGEGLSPKARINLGAAVEALLDFIQGFREGESPGKGPARTKEKPCRKKKSSS